MFDLDKTLAAWRSSYMQRPAFSEEDLDELEQHLRDETQELIQAGMSPQSAFKQALQNMGNRDTAEAEYGKVFWPKARRQRRVKDEVIWRLAMLKNYGRVAFRSMRKQKVYSLINLSGLTIGLACFILILLFVKHEFSYDRFFENSENIYRVVVHEPGEMHIGSDKWAVTPAPLAKALTAEFAEILRSTSIDDFKTEKALLSTENQHYWEKGFWGDAHFLSIFSFPLLRGNIESALSNPNSIVLTETLAGKIYGEQNPIGQTLKLDNLDNYTVTAVLKDLPKTSSFQFAFVASIQSQEQYAFSLANEEWNNSSWQTFFVLDDNARISAIEAQLPGLIAKYVGNGEANVLREEYRIQALHDIHLRSDYNGELASTGDITQVYVFLAIALVILILACINYINLAIARSTGRIREVGLRKVVGAGRRQLFIQFLGESVFMTILSLLFAIGIALLFMHPFASMVQRPLEMGLLQEGLLLPGLFALALFVGVFSGIYPAFHMAIQEPLLIIKGNRNGRSSRHTVQKALIVLQYTASTVLIVCGITIYQQLQFVQQKDVGFDKDQVLSIPVYDEALFENFEKLQTEWLRNPQINTVTYTRHLPTRINSSTNIRGWENSLPEDKMAIYETAVLHDFLDVFGIKLLAGRMFSKARQGDYENSYLINETAARLLGWTPQDALGKTFLHNGRLRTVIGIMEDFHIHSMHHTIEPFMIRLASKSTGFFALKIQPQNLDQTLAYLRQTAASITPYPFEYNFLDEEFGRLYEEEENLAQTVSFFTLLAVFVSSLGLFGLAAFAAEQRTKEIGIRKVLGATTSGITMMLSREFTVLVLLSTLVATPIGYLTMQRWLERFAYHINIDPTTFITTGLLTLAIALLTVSYQSIKAAMANPVKSLRFD